MNATQEIVAALKRKPRTYAEMLLCCGHIASTSPHKRALEFLDTVEGQKWELRKSKRWQGGSRYLTEWRIVRRRK